LRFFGGLFFAGLLFLNTILVLRHLLRDPLPPPYTLFTQYFALAIPCVLAVVIGWTGYAEKVSRRFLRRYRRFVAEPSSTLSFYLCRISGDEASLVLYVTQALEAAIAALLVAMERFLANISDTPPSIRDRMLDYGWAKLPGPRILIWLSYLLLCLVFGIGAGLAFLIIGLLAVGLLTMIITYGTSIILFVARLVVGATLLTLSIGGGILYGLTYGWECSTLITCLSLGCDPAPEGKSSISYLSVDGIRWTPREGSLIHASYDHPEMLRWIADTFHGDLSRLPSRSR